MKKTKKAITAKEFDRKFDRGEDISDYFDMSKAVMKQPSKQEITCLKKEAYDETKWEELRWLNGARIYSFLWGSAIVVALYGGNKNAQNRDVQKAKKIRDEVLEGTRTFHK